MHGQQRRRRSLSRRLTGAGTLALVLGAWTAGADPMVIYSTEGNRLRRYDVDTLDRPPLVEDILIERASAQETGGVARGDFRDVNGMICLLPDGSGRFVAGEDTGQPTTPAGWGVFSPDGRQIGKLAPTSFAGQPEPFGCAFDRNGILFTTEVGDPGFGANNGQLIMWFPPYDRFPGPPGAYPNTSETSGNFCKLATNIGTAAGIAIDGQGRLYVAGASNLAIFRFSPPFPTSPEAAGGCGATDALGSPMADQVNREVFTGQGSVPGLATFTGLALAPNGNLYASVILSGMIFEFDTTTGALVRTLLDPPENIPPISTGTPQSLSVGPDGTLYYADLDLVGEFPDLGPGPDGKVWRLRLDENGDPRPPEIVRDGLAFPDGVAVFPGDLEPLEWRTYAGGPSRLFFNAAESSIRADNVGQLETKWSFPTGAIITASPSVARVTVPGEGRIPVAYIQSWDANVYAVRIRDGSELWRFATEDRPGPNFPNTASVHVENVEGQERVLIGNGQTFYALDAATGEELWRFDTGTGCVVPGQCDYDGERNEIESSAIVADGKVFFGMDVNDRVGGKGGFYALDLQDGRLAWFFDLESGATCRPLPGDEIRRFDGYHSEAELGLPPGFLATRPGCDFPRSPNGCGNVWSSAALDEERELLFIASSNCDTDDDPETLQPPPPMPPYDEAIFALRYDGTPVWRWRPREVDNGDLAFGGVPNLFRIFLDGAERDVVGVGNKDGSYYVLDRDGVNEINQVRWDDADPSGLPYWTTNVVPGGTAGGILATAAVDAAARRIYFGTAPGSFASVFNPQRPTVHALDADTGEILWQNTGEAVDPTGESRADATFSPTSAVPGVVFTGSIVLGFLRGYDATDGTKVANELIGLSAASAPAVIDGLVMLGAGVGFRTGNPDDQSDANSRIPHNVNALCVPGTRACAVDVPVAGELLRVVDGGSVGRSHLTLVAEDPAIALPAPGGEADPSLVGAELWVLNPFTGQQQRIALPATRWSAFGDPLEGYRYRDPDHGVGPCERVHVKAGEIHARCSGDALDFPLSDSPQETLAAAFTLGDARVYCARFGGSVARDVPTTEKRRGSFTASQASAPEHCPLP